MVRVSAWYIGVPATAILGRNMIPQGCFGSRSRQLRCGRSTFLTTGAKSVTSNNLSENPLRSLQCCGTLSPESRNGGGCVVIAKYVP